MAKRKPINVEIIKRTKETEAADGVYGVMDSIIASCRPDLAEVAIGLAWRYGWKPNADGFLRAGFCKKRGDLDRALDSYDFVILLNAEAWPEMTEPERRRLMHHELCHAQVCTDENGDTKFDTSGRPCCRVRKHDIEEFFEVAEQYGLESTINQIAQAAIQDADRPLLKLQKAKGETAEATEDTEDAEVVETPETAEERPGSVETLRFKARGVRQCGVTLRLGRYGEGRYRCGWDWNVGNYGWVCPVEDRPAAESRSQCLEEVRQVVLQSLADMEITGTADQRRAIESRRDTLSEQFNAWMEEQIGEAKPHDDQEGDDDGDDE